jgi:acyl-CoA thioesterase FadM
MNLWFRVIAVLIGALVRARRGVLSTSVLGFWVLPTDLDLNVHMTNARYLSFMDLGRTDLIIRTGLARVMWRHKLQAVIGGSMVRFRRPLRPFQRFSVHTRLLAWDERWLYIEQTLTSNGVVACSAQIKGAFVQKGKIMAPAALFALLGESPDTPHLPEWVGQWKEAEAAAFPAG